MSENELSVLADLIATRLRCEKLAYTVRTAAIACDLPESTILSAINTGGLRSTKPGKQYVITRESLLKWLGG